MRQLIQTFLIDVRMSIKSFMGVYMLIVPTIILIVLRTFIPSVESTSANIAVVTAGPNAVDPALVESLEQFAHVVSYETVEEVEQRLRGTGSFEGLYWDPAAGQYVSVVERSRDGNTLFSGGARVVRQFTYQSIDPDGPTITRYSHGVPPELSDRSKTSPVATVGGSIFIAFTSIIFGFMIGLNLVNDKEEGTDMALKVSPVSKVDYFVGKAIFPFLLTLLYAMIALAVLRLFHVNIFQTYVVAIASFASTLLIGLLLGALAKNENEAIGIGKLVGMVVALSILGGTLLPDNWQWAVWWSPFYWVFDALGDIFTDSADWATLGWKSAVIIGATGIYFFLLKKRIIKGLS